MYGGLLGRAEASPTLVMFIEIFSICAVRRSVYMHALILCIVWKLL